MKQKIMMWAVINNVTQEVCLDAHLCPLIHDTRARARRICEHQKSYHGNPAARVRRVKVTVEDA